MWWKQKAFAMFAEKYLLEFSCLHPSVAHLLPWPSLAHLVFTSQQTSQAFGTLSVVYLLGFLR